MDSDLPSAVLTALGTVRDPELDESIVDLGFVTETVVRGGHAAVRLRLPTYFCAPNFAYLMVADAYDAVRAVPGVRSASVVLDDHLASAEINAGVAADAGFVGSFPNEAAAELDELRLNFQRKAHTACLERACQRLLASGWTIETLSEAALVDLPAGPERASLLRRRADIGFPVSDDSALFVDDAGVSVPADQVPLRLRYARTVRVSIDGNAHFCRGLLTTRYPEAAADQRPREAEQEALA
ncbi:MAG: iron-sulfur cluster assembly protein [Jatrophihabitantaceae bacterium]